MAHGGSGLLEGDAVAGAVSVAAGAVDGAGASEVGAPACPGWKGVKPPGIVSPVFIKPGGTCETGEPTLEGNVALSCGCWTGAAGVAGTGANAGAEAGAETGAPAGATAAGVGFSGFGGQPNIARASLSLGLTKSVTFSPG